MSSFDISRQLRAFDITDADLAVLRGLRPVLAEVLEDILVESRQHFAAWPEVVAALASPEIHAARCAHWTMAAGGDFGAAFIESALRFSAAFVAGGIPAHSLVLCHNAVLAVATARLTAATVRRFGPFGGSERQLLARRLDALRKATWLDIEILMETYNIAAAAARTRMLSGLADEFETVVGSVVEGVQHASNSLERTAQSLASASEQALRQASAVAAASEQATGSVQTVASASEELASSIAEIGRQVREATRVADKAARDAETTAAQVRDLSASAQRIGEVVDLISSIAGQTNLLALNATIEAARAGDAGRGFAVVAAEVKQLAEQTARATSTISAQIGAIQGSTADSVTSISGISAVIGQLNEIALAVSGAVEQQDAATREITHNVMQASQGTAEVTGNIVGVSTAASRTADSSRDVLEETRALAGQTGTLRREANAFVGRIRAA